jgi:hypothetical protein
MTKNTKIVALAAIAMGVLLVLAFLWRDLWLTPKAISCSDGPRRTIDTRDFDTKYFGYSMEFEIEVTNKASFSGKLGPVKLQQLSEALQSANEFRKYIVHGFNACAISAEKYDQYGARFQTLDNISREMAALVTRPSLTHEERAQLSSLTEQYLETARKLGD